MLLDAIRAVPADRAVRHIRQHLDELEPRHVDHDDVVQEAVLRAVRFANRARASTEQEARGWLRRLLHNVRIDVRSRTARKECLLLDGNQDVVAGDPIAVHDADRELLALELDLLGRIEIAHHRRWAMASLLRHVHAHRSADLAALFSSRAACWKAIQRGRDNVLLPLLADDDSPLAARLAEVLRGTRRRDHGGEERPLRRARRAA